MLNKLSAVASKVMNATEKAPPPEPKASGMQVNDAFCRAPVSAASPGAMEKLGSAVTELKDAVISASKKILGNGEKMELSEAGAAEYEKLSEEERADFDELYEATEGDRAARKNLETLLASGALASESNDEPPQTLLEVLHEIATTEDYQNGYTADQVLDQTMEGIANPSGDGQDPDDVTCGARSMLHTQATETPAEYAQSLLELARDGQITRPGEEPATIQSEPGTDLNHEAARALTAAETTTGTVNENGETVMVVKILGREITIPLGSGMRAGDFTDALNSNFPEANYQAAYLDPKASPDSPETQEAVALARESIENGGKVYVKAVDGDTAHWIPIDGIDEDGNASYVDANGDTQTVPADELLAGCDAMALDANTGVQVPPELQTPPEGGDIPGTGFPNGSTTQGDGGRGKGIMSP